MKKLLFIFPNKSTENSRFLVLRISCMYVSLILVLDLHTIKKNRLLSTLLLLIDDISYKKIAYFDNFLYHHDYGDDHFLN